MRAPVNPRSAVALATLLLSLWGRPSAIANEPAPARERAAAAATPSTSTFVFTPTYGAPIKVYLAQPHSLDDKTRVVFALHGMTRNAKATFSAWRDALGEANVVLVAPEFDERGYPSSAYNLGNTREKVGRENPPREWSFQAIEAIFDAVVTRTNVSAKTYTLYGHSAGAQFTHRFAMLMPTSIRASAFISANAGWYTFPDTEVAYPFGLKGAAESRPSACEMYARKLTVLLGEADNDPNHHQLSKSAGAMAQGEQRFARGKRFFAAADRDAKVRKCRFAWELVTVPGVAHEQEKMALAAARLLQTLPQTKAP
jgi:poly(3-hydroxybutyrate) depolymerase